MKVSYKVILIAVAFLSTSILPPADTEAEMRCPITIKDIWNKDWALFVGEKLSKLDNLTDEAINIVEGKVKPPEMIMDGRKWVRDKYLCIASLQELGTNKAIQYLVNNIATAMETDEFSHKGIIIFENTPLFVTFVFEFRQRASDWQLIFYAFEALSQAKPRTNKEIVYFAELLRSKFEVKTINPIIEIEIQTARDKQNANALDNFSRIKYYLRAVETRNKELLKKYYSQFIDTDSKRGKKKEDPSYGGGWSMKLDDRFAELDDLTDIFISIAAGKVAPAEIKKKEGTEYERARFEAIVLLGKLKRTKAYQFLVDNITMNLNYDDNLAQYKEPCLDVLLSDPADWRIIPYILKALGQKKTDKELNYFARALSKIPDTKSALAIIQGEIETTKNEVYLNNLKQVKASLENMERGNK